MTSYFEWAERKTGAAKPVPGPSLDHLEAIAREALRDLQAAQLAGQVWQ